MAIAMDDVLARDLRPTIEAVDPLADPRWLSMAEAHGSIFSSPPWL